MRWPIQRQLLVPFLAVVAATVAVSSATTAYVAAGAARRQEAEQLARAVATLGDAGFPLTPIVLQKMSGLSGAQFVVVDGQGQIVASTLAVAPTELAALIALEPLPITDLSASPSLPFGTQRFLSARAPAVARTPGGTPMSLFVLSPEERWQQVAREAFYPPLWVGGAAALAAAIAAALAARPFVGRIQRLSSQAAAIAQGDFRPAPVSDRDDELRDLTISLNSMAEQLARYEDQVRRNERLKLLGQLGGGIAHQLRNSAAGARLALELHGQECPLGPDCESVGVAMRQLRLMETYVQRLLTLGKQTGRPRAQVALDELAAEVVELVRPNCSHHGVALRFTRPSEPVNVQGDLDALRQVLVNLLVNAVEAAQKQAAEQEKKGEIEVEVFARAGRAFVRVFDTGPGPAAGVQDRLFEPFVSDKPDGTGLGLSVSKQVAESHGGGVRWRRDGDRTCFECEIAAQP